MIKFKQLKKMPWGGLTINNKIKVACVFGTRPEAVKMAPVVLALKEHPAFDTRVIVTAQHREMLDSMLNTFGIQPDIDLNIMRGGQTLPEVVSRVMTGVGDILTREKPDIALVHGDTATTFASALAAFYSRVRVGHVEAGLRTFNKLEPYPEEMNRLLTTSLTDVFFAPTVKAKNNLLRENINPEDIFVTGNTEMDAVYRLLKNKDEYKFKEDALNHLDNSKRLIVMTAHRNENIGEPMEAICRAMARVMSEHTDALLVWPLHPNPKVRVTANAILGGMERVCLTEWLDVEDMYHLMSRAYMAATDSAGVQEMSPALDVPAVVLRNVTERPEGVEAGAMIIGGNAEEGVYTAVSRVLNDSALYKSMAAVNNPFGDGQASARILQGLMKFFNLSDKRPQEFI